MITKEHVYTDTSSETSDGKNVLMFAKCSGKHMELVL